MTNAKTAEPTTMARSTRRVRNMTVTAMLSAVAAVLMFFDFSLPMFIPSFVKMDISELPALLAAFSMGPVSGVVVCLVKNILAAIFHGSTGGIGEVCNFLLGAAFVGSAGVIYKYKKTRLGAVIAALVGSVVMAVISVFPFLWMIISATNSSMDIILGKMSFGGELVNNIHNLLDAGDLLNCLKNSAILSVFITTVSILVCSLAGYGFVVFKSKGKEFWFSVILLSMMIPTSSLIIPLFKMFSGMGLLNTKLGVMLPSLSTAFLIFFFRQNTKSFPLETIQAARIDGLGELGIFFKIYMPMMKPTYSAAIIITFMSSWNNYMWPLISLQTPDQRTLPLLISSLGTAYTPDYGMIMVGIIITTIPSALIFFLMQKSFVNSMMGSVK